VRSRGKTLFARRCLVAVVVAAAVLILPIHLPAAAEGGHDEGPSQLLQMIIKIINFSILAFLLVKYLSKPITSFFETRSETLKAKLETMQQERDEARRVLQTYTEKHEKIEEKIKTAKAQAAEDMEKERQKVLDEAEQAAEEILGHARETIQREMIKAKSELHAEAVDLSLELAEGLIRKNIDNQDHRRFAEDYIERLTEES
jgi:F-type H+-transporting ATPase subunit b